ncbi:MAG: hypothetical protein Q9165_003955 [Trypethelium subeluteriae]
MAPRNGGGSDAPHTTQQQQETLPSNDPPFPEREHNPFASFRRLVDQQFESMFNAMIPASRYEDSPFWEQKEPQPSQDHIPRKPSRRSMYEEVETMRQQWKDMESDMEREIARACADASKQLPWFWNNTTSNEKKPATGKQGGSREHAQSLSPTSSKHPSKQDANTDRRPKPMGVASPGASSGPPLGARPGANDVSSLNGPSGPLPSACPASGPLPGTYPASGPLTGAYPGAYHVPPPGAPPAAPPAASPHVSSSSSGPDTEEQAYLFLNFPHARDQLRSLEREASSLAEEKTRSSERKLASPDRAHNEGSSPMSIFAPFMRQSSDTTTRDDHNREQAETDELLNTLREALRGVEPWERARVTEQLPEAQQVREELRERQCPWGRKHRNGFGEDWREARKAKIANVQRQRQEEQQQQQQQKEEKSTPDRTVKAPWWWMGAIWDPTFPREADGYGMKRYAPLSSQKHRTTASTSRSPAIVADPSTSQDGGKELQPRRRQWPGQTENQVQVFTSSLTTTTSSTPQPDGSVLTRIVMEKRHPDGRDERNETVFTQRPGEDGLRLQQEDGADARRLLGMGPAIGRLERNTRMEEASKSSLKEQEVGAGKREGKARRGWFWAS